MRTAHPLNKYSLVAQLLENSEVQDFFVETYRQIEDSRIGDEAPIIIDDIRKVQIADPVAFDIGIFRRFGSFAQLLAQLNTVIKLIVSGWSCTQRQSVKIFAGYRARNLNDEESPTLRVLPCWIGNDRFDDMACLGGGVLSLTSGTPVREGISPAPRSRNRILPPGTSRGTSEPAWR